MENIEIKIKGDTLILEIDLTKNLRPSKTGKSDIVATSAGAIFIEELQEYGYKLSMTVFKLDPQFYTKRDIKEYVSKNPKPIVKKRNPLKKEK